MSRSPFILFLALLAGLLPARALDLTHKSASLSRQFVVYCDDANARLKIADFAEETKTSLLSLLGQTDHWKLPVVITVEPARAANPSARASSVQLCQTEEGGKVALSVTLGADPHEIRFQQQLVRALLLEFAYRDQPPAAGVVYVEPPLWLIEGAVEFFHSRGQGVEPDVFQSLLGHGHLPSLTDFLGQTSNGADRVSRNFYSACAMSLVQLLIDLPQGHLALAALVKHLPNSTDDPTAMLIKHFPALGATTPSLEKWWALSMARLAASDRYQGLSLPATEQRLAPMLSLEIPVGKSAEKKKFTLDQFEEFEKLPACRAALAELSTNLLGLGAQGSALFRPVIADYQQITADLARGKTRGVPERLAAAANYRELLLTRIDQIADYLNWFEATQMIEKSDSFDDYMKTARALAHDTTRRTDGITRYMDVVQKQLE